mgnify:CR=1 FL=1
MRAIARVVVNSNGAVITVARCPECLTCLRICPFGVPRLADGRLWHEALAALVAGWGAASVGERDRPGVVEIGLAGVGGRHGVEHDPAGGPMGGPPQGMRKYMGDGEEGGVPSPEQPDSISALPEPDRDRIGGSGGILTGYRPFTLKDNSVLGTCDNSNRQQEWLSTPRQILTGQAMPTGTSLPHGYLHGVCTWIRARGPTF